MCCSPRGHKESDTTERLNKNNWGHVLPVSTKSEPPTRADHPGRPPRLKLQVTLSSGWALPPFPAIPDSGPPAQTLQAHTKAFFSSCPTGTDLIIKGKHGGLRGYGGFSETGLREQTQF